MWCESMRYDSRWLSVVTLHTCWTLTIKIILIRSIIQSLCNAESLKIAHQMELITPLPLLNGAFVDNAHFHQIKLRNTWLFLQAHRCTSDSRTLLYVFCTMWSDNVLHSGRKSERLPLNPKELNGRRVKCVCVCVSQVVKTKDWKFYRKLGSSSVLESREYRQRKRSRELDITDHSLSSSLCIPGNDARRHIKQICWSCFLLDTCLYSLNISGRERAGY